MPAAAQCIDGGLDLNIRSRLHSLNADLFEALEGDSRSLVSFDHSWTNFSKTVNLCHDELQNDTLQMIYTFAATVGVVTSSLLELQDTSDTMYQELAADITQILDENMSHLTINERPPPVQINSYPTYIKPSYLWLLENLHNPYPSKETRNAIAYQSGSHCKDIDGWFVDARRRIGWNALRKSRFANRRADILDAASQFFIISDLKRPLDSIIELEFAAIESRAKDLYSEKLLESSLAIKLDVSVRDMTPMMKAQAKAWEKQRKQSGRRRKVHGADCYPSPEASPGASPEPSSPTALTDHLAEEHLSKRKRQNSISAYSLDNEEERSIARPLKRNRLESPAIVDNSGVNSLPSPAASLHEVPDDIQSPIAAAFSIPQAIKRKRRLSHGDSQRTAKRPHIACSTPRLQAVSDPLSMPTAVSSFDEWYQNTFFTKDQTLVPGIPPAVSVEAPDASTPLDIEIYNFSSTAIPAPELPPSGVLTPPILTAIDAKSAPSERLYSGEDPFCWFNNNTCDLGPVDQEHATTPVSLTSFDEFTQAFDLDHTTEDAEYTDLKSPSISLPEWNPASFSYQDPPARSSAFFENHPSELLGFSPGLTTAITDHNPFELSLQSQKEMKQRELYAVQQRLLTLQAELASPH